MAGIIGTSYPKEGDATCSEKGSNDEYKHDGAGDERSRSLRIEGLERFRLDRAERGERGEAFEPVLCLG